MKIISYNIREGLLENYTDVKKYSKKPKLRIDLYKNLKEFLQKQKADIVGLQELSGWKEEMLEQLMFDTKYKDFYFSKSATHHNMGFLFREKSEIKKNYLEYYRKDQKEDKSNWWKYRNFWHSLPYVNYKGINTFLIHLCPNDNPEKNYELEFLLGTLKNKKTILMGDFNSLRKNDFSEGVYKKLSEKQRNKFGPANKKSVVDKLVDFGLTDIFNNVQNNSTTPTKSNIDKAHAGLSLRLDYVLVSKDLSDLVFKRKIVKNDITDKISDHYPLMLELDM